MASKGGDLFGACRNGLRLPGSTQNPMVMRPKRKRTTLAKCSVVENSPGSLACLSLPPRDKMALQRSAEIRDPF